MIISILGAIFTFGIIVFIHELGHFLSAKAFGMHVEEFAIGLGPEVFKKRKGETLYSIRLLPLGGYNKIAGMEPDDTSPRGFNSKPVWQRFIVIAAGATFNFILAIVMYATVFMSVGVQTPSTEPVIGHISPNMPAAKAELQLGDRIVSINGNEVVKFSSIRELLAGEQHHVVTLIINRNGEEKEVTVIPEEAGGLAIIGVGPALDSKELGIGESIGAAVDKTVHTGLTMLGGIKDLITGSSGAELAGPLGVAQMAGQVAQTGIINLLLFTALLSLNLGIINLLPIPVLDGGHLILLIIEGITRRKLPPKALEYIQMTGVIILVAIFIYSTSSDVLRIWN